MSPFSPATLIARLRSPLSKGLIIMLLALALGIGMGTRSPAAHADSINTCTISQLGHNYRNLPLGWGRLDVYLWAKVHTYDNTYCGPTWAEAYLHETYKNTGGVLYAFQEDCSSPLPRQLSDVTLPTGDGGVAAGPGTYWALNTHNANIVCAQAVADFRGGSVFAETEVPATIMPLLRG